jgi:hypothetical protein
MSTRRSHAAQGQALTLARQIAEEFGPRLAGSPAEVALAHWLETRWRGHGLVTSLQPVRVLPEPNLGFTLALAFLVVGAVLQQWQPLLAACCAALGTATLISELDRRNILSPLLPTRLSYNVVGVRRAAGRALQRIVLLAHLDTPRANLLAYGRAQLVFRQNMLLVANAGLLLCALLVPEALGVAVPARWLVPLLGVYLAVILALSMYGTLSLPLPAGANDNGSGLAVITSLVEEGWQGRHSEVWFVATAGHETGLWGVKGFLANHRWSGQRVFFLNIDSVGAGVPTLLLSEGHFARARCPAELVHRVARAARDAAVVARAMPSSLPPSDGYAALRRGYLAGTLVGTDPRGIVTNWHSPHDRQDALDPAALANVCSLVRSLLVQLDNEATLPL